MKMRKFLPLALLLALASGALSAQMRQVTDMAGRKVSVPREIHKVYCMNPACSMAVFSLAPERLMSWSLQLTDKERSYLPAPYNKLSGMSSMTSGGMGPMSDPSQANIEQLIRLHPDVIMFLNDPSDRSGLERMEKIQEQTGIPTFLIDMRLRATPDVYTKLGDLFGMEKRAAQLAAYTRLSFEEVESKVRTIPADKRPRVYYAYGPNGMSTFFEGAPHAEAIAFAGGYNVARGGEGQRSGSGQGQGGAHGDSRSAMSMSRGQISVEQLISWEPQVILVGADRAAGDKFFRQTIWNDPLWKGMPAVRNRAVYNIPAYPFSWISPPASINRILGIKWLAQTLHPDLFHYDMKKEARTFYALFYHKTLSEAELRELLQ